MQLTFDFSANTKFFIRVNLIPKYEIQFLSEFLRYRIFAMTSIDIFITIFLFVKVFPLPYAPQSSW